MWDINSELGNLLNSEYNHKHDEKNIMKQGNITDFRMPPFAIAMLLAPESELFIHSMMNAPGTHNFQILFFGVTFEFLRCCFCSVWEQFLHRFCCVFEIYVFVQNNYKNHEEISIFTQLIVCSK